MQICKIWGFGKTRGGGKAAMAVMHRGFSKKSLCRQQPLAGQNSMNGSRYLSDLGLYIWI